MKLPHHVVKNRSYWDERVTTIRAFTASSSTKRAGLGCLGHSRVAPQRARRSSRQRHTRVRVRRRAMVDLFGQTRRSAGRPRPFRTPTGTRSTPDGQGGRFFPAGCCQRLNRFLYLTLHSTLFFATMGRCRSPRPERTVAEASRLLRPGGLFAFNIASPFLEVCWNDADDWLETSLQRDYFEMRGGEDENTVVFQLPYGEWIRLFRRHGFALEDLIELRPPPDATTSYTKYVTREWARRWPAENIWKLRKMDATPSSRRPHRVGSNRKS